MPNASLGQGLLSSPRQLAGEQGVIAMPEQAIEMEELSSADSTPRGTLRKAGSLLSLTSPRPESDITPGEAFMLKFSRMSTHLANERTLLAWLRTSAAFFSMGLAFAKIDQFEDDVVSVAFVSVGILTFIVGCIRYYQVKTVLETKDSDFKTAQGFKRLGAGRMLSAAVLAFGIAATCLLYQSFRELSTTGVHFTGAGAGTSTGHVASSNSAGTPDPQLAVLQDILAALNAQTGQSTGGDKTGGG